MAFFIKFLAMTLLVSFLICHVTLAEEDMTSTFQDSAKLDCGGACRNRCALSSRPNLCHRACGTCCARCNCVPSGTSGNKASCACYYKMTTHGGRPKCP